MFNRYKSPIGTDWVFAVQFRGRRLFVTIATTSKKQDKALTEVLTKGLRLHD